MGSSRGHRYCEACAKAVAPIYPSRLWHLGNVGAWAFIFTAGPFLAVMPPLNLVTVPIFIFAASAMVGRVGEELNRAPSCPHCGRDVPETSAAPKLAGRLAGPAHERLVKGALVREAELVRDLRQ